MKILIVEDEPLMAQSHEMMVELLGHEVVGVADNAVKALQLVDKNIPDLVLMDIQIEGEMDGIDLAATIFRQYATPVIFITSLRDDATFQRASAVMPLAYILKPFDRFQLKLHIELALRQLQIKKQAPEMPPLETPPSKIENSFFVRSKGKLLKLLFSEIVYMEADGRYSTIFMESGHKHTVRQTLGELEAKVPNDTFFRTHRSFVINLDHLESIDTSDMVVWVRGDAVSLSKEKKTALGGMLARI